MRISVETYVNVCVPDTFHCAKTVIYLTLLIEPKGEVMLKPNSVHNLIGRHKWSPSEKTGTSQGDRRFNDFHNCISCPYFVHGSGKNMSIEFTETNRDSGSVNESLSFFCSLSIVLVISSVAESSKPETIFPEHAFWHFLFQGRSTGHDGGS